MAKDIPLTLVASEIRARYGASSVTYQRLQRAAADGRLPGLTRQGGRLFVEVGALPQVAELFGLTAAAARNAA